MQKFEFKEPSELTEIRIKLMRHFKQINQQLKMVRSPKVVNSFQSILQSVFNLTLFDFFIITARCQMRVHCSSIAQTCHCCRR